MNLKEKMYQKISEEAGGMSGYRIAAQSCTKIAEEFACEFASWYLIELDKPTNFINSKAPTIQEHLTKFKEENK